MVRRLIRRIETKRINMTYLKFNNRPVAKASDFFSEFFGTPGLWPSPASDFSTPAVNVYENPQSVILELSAPGRQKEDFNLHVDKDLLTVSYEKKEENISEQTKVVRREYSFNSFKRTFSLDEKIDVEKITAHYENGVLKIELPKKEHFKAEPRQIAIN